MTEQTRVRNSDLPQTFQNKREEGEETKGEKRYHWCPVDVRKGHFHDTSVILRVLGWVLM